MKKNDDYTDVMSNKISDMNTYQSFIKKLKESLGESIIILKKVMRLINSLRSLMIKKK
jgi:hypothetical protein